MPGLVPGIHESELRWSEGVDGRDKPGHDDQYLLWLFLALGLLFLGALGRLRRAARERRAIE